MGVRFCEPSKWGERFFLIIDWRWHEGWSSLAIPITSRNVNSLSNFWSIIAKVLKRAVLSILEYLWKSFPELFAPSFVGLVSQSGPPRRGTSPEDGLGRIEN